MVTHAEESSKLIASASSDTLLAVSLSRLDGMSKLAQDALTCAPDGVAAMRARFWRSTEADVN